MKCRPLGRTKLEITEVSFGGTAIGNLYRPATREDAEATLEAAWAGGIRYFDTAPFYGFGLSERRMGDFLRGKPRGSYVLSTKVGRLLRAVPEDQVPEHGYADPLPFAVDYDYSYDGVMRSVEFSLARLGLNRIDILLVHDIGARTHGVQASAGHFRELMDGGMKALEKLKGDGTIAAFGLGVNEVEICVDVMARAEIDCILLAGRYTLMDRSAEARLLPLCEKRGTSLIIGGVFNSGILATGPIPGSHFNYAPASSDILERVGNLQTVAQKHGLPLAAAALKFPLLNPVVATVLLGTASPVSLKRNLDMLNMHVPDSAWSEFDALAIGA